MEKKDILLEAGVPTLKKEFFINSLTQTTLTFSLHTKNSKMPFPPTTLQPPPHPQRPEHGVLAGFCVSHALSLPEIRPLLTDSRRETFQYESFCHCPHGKFRLGRPPMSPPSPLPPRAKWVFRRLSARKLAPVCMGRHLWWTRPSTRWDPSDYCEVEFRCFITEGAVCQPLAPFISLLSPRRCCSDYGRPLRLLPLAPVGPNPP